LRKDIENRAQEKTIEQIYKDTFNLLKAVLGNKSQDNLIKEFETQLVKKGKFTQQHMRILNNIVEAKAQFKKGKLNAHKVNDARKEASILINDLIDYTQRCDLAMLEKGRMKIKYKESGKDQIADILTADNTTFVFHGTRIGKVTGKTIDDATMDEVNQAVEAQKSKNTIEIDTKIFEVLKKELGEFEIVL